MRFLSEFSYPDTAQRKVILFNEFITFVMLGFISFSLSAELQNYFYYLPVFNFVYMAALLGLFSGAIFGRFIFSRINNSRIIYFLTDVLFITACGVYFFDKLNTRGEISSLLDLSVRKSYSVLMIFLLVSFFAGIKINYFLKTLCGDFIDDKRGIYSFFNLFLFGSLAGFILGITLYYYNSNYYSGILAVLLLPTAFIIKLSFNPSPQYAQDFGGPGEKGEREKSVIKKDELFHTYLNFTYIMIYFFLGFASFIKIYGDLIYVKTVFIVLSLASVYAGFVSARIIKRSIRYIYAGMLYPFFFLIFLISIYNLNNDMDMIKGGLFFTPVSFISGFILYHTLTNILLNNNQKDSYNIIDISFFILPAPVFIILSMINYTNFLYFMIFYLIAAVNIIVPVIYMTRSSAKPYKKIIYAFCSILIIPLSFIFHSHYDMSLDGAAYAAPHVAGYDRISGIDYNSGFINKNADIFINDIKAFILRDGIIRNMKRSLVPVYMFLSDDDNALFIDGCRKFFRNPVINNFRNAAIIDYIPDNYIYPARQSSPDSRVVNSDILEYLAASDSRFKAIVDIPNIYDQRQNVFRFSPEYYYLIKKYIKPGGFFVQIFDLKNCRAELLEHGIKSLNDSFKEGISFLFADQLVVLCADNPAALRITRENVFRLKNFLINSAEIGGIFYSEFHVLSHVLFLELEDILAYLEKDSLGPFFFMSDFKNVRIDRNLTANFIEKNNIFLKLIAEDQQFSDEVKKDIWNNNNYLSMLKEAEMDEAGEQYENEAEKLIQLQKCGVLDFRLYNYINRLLTVNKDYFYSMALKQEKEKKWEDARTFYRAILVIDKDDFEANYRLGILCITLQDFDDSLNYLQYALKLKGNDPKVLYQIGVLHFSRGEPRLALDYLDQALQKNEKTAALFLYLGLCSEELDRLQDAKRYYELALIEDENDSNIKSGIERIKGKIAGDKDKWKPAEQKSQTEVEVGEDMPLPIIDSARKVRLSEEEAVLFEKKEDKEENGKAKNGTR